MGVTILLAEDQIVIREGLRSLIGQQNDMEVVGEADNGKIALQLAQEFNPDVIIMDVAMPEMNGIEATELVKEKMPDIKVIALSAHDNREYVMSMIKAGVSGYLLKDYAFEELVKAIETVMRGKSYLCPEIATIVLKAQADDQNSVEKAVLNQRDINMIKLLAEGKSARHIAQQEDLSIKTIEGRRRRVMEKLGIDNMAELIRFAIEKGLISTKTHD